MDFVIIDCLYILKQTKRRKTPPFEGTSKQSDKGFKDAVFEKGTYNYSKIKSYILASDEVHKQYINWMEEQEDYGPLMTIIGTKRSCERINVRNFFKAWFSVLIINQYFVGDYEKTCWIMSDYLV